MDCLDSVRTLLGFPAVQAVHMDYQGDSKVLHKRGVENDNSNITLLKPEYFWICAMWQGHLLIDRSEKETISKIRKCNDLDEEVIKALKEMKGEKKKSIREDEWVEEQGLILFREKVYVPRDEELRKEITCLHHNTSILGHPGC